MLPIHRWLMFADSWSPASVEFLLDTLKTDSSDIIYDPFVGCGTTLVVCSRKGMCTIGSDINSLAVATTRVKLNPPSKQQLNSLKHIVKESEPEKLLLDFANGALSDSTSAETLQLLQFVLAASLIRIGWHEGAALEMRNVEAEIDKLLDEMSADIVPRSNVQPPSRVFCSDFFAIAPRNITSFARGDVVMISSPPFFGSSFNPAIRKLERLLGEPILRNEKDLRSPGWSVPEALPILEAFRHDGCYKEVADYLFFLDSIVVHAIKTGCRAVGLEMGPKIVEGLVVRFDLFLAERLVANNYEIDFCEVTELEPEVCSTICAHRI